MPQTHPIGIRPERAPVALFLRPNHPHRPVDSAGRALADWYGVHPDHLALLIARYTRDGDLVLDADAHPTVVAAAEHLHRRSGVVVTEGEQPPARLGLVESDSPASIRPDAGLVLATLPRLSVDHHDVHALSRALGEWQALLRPGGFLVVLLTAGPGTGAVGHRSTVVAAALSAGLLYHQHIPALLVPLAETQPHIDPRPAARPTLIAGRHVRTHRDLVVFTTLAAEAADA